MGLPKDDAAVLSARWTEGVLLKRDVFSTVERGRFRSDAGEVDAVLRRLDEVPWWSHLLAWHLFARERRALALARGPRRPRLCYRFSARGMLQEPQPAVPHRRVRRSAAYAEAQAQLCPGSVDAERAKNPRPQVFCRKCLARHRQEGLSGHHPWSV